MYTIIILATVYSLSLLTTIRFGYGFLFLSFGDPRYERQNVIFRSMLTLNFREVALVVFKDGQNLKIIALSSGSHLEHLFNTVAC
jgi:hypothetical protein